ncbi:MAG: LuxR C-terminal-related transcriptional regulator [Coriobacteriales bacterium]|jgi:LuxR family maltose regulon positive regulatory protein|nr:LuxR C-terminal-related transcriptional regulator [Coriobacteriales bacterium]
MRTTQWVAEATQHLSKNEIADYFERRGLEVPPDALAEIFADTAGRVQSVRLVGDLLETHPHDIKYVKSAYRHTMQTVIRERVFTVCTPAARTLLIELSLLMRLPFGLVAELAQDEATLAELLASSSFFSYDTFLCEYRMHPILLDFLRGKQGELSVEQRRKTLGTAARWCIEHELVLDACLYHEQLGDYDAITDLASTLTFVIPPEKAEGLLEIFNRAPRSLFSTNPAAPVVHVRFLLSLGRVDEARAAMHDYIARIESLPQTPATRQSLFGLYNNLGFAGLVQCIETGDYEFWQYFKQASAYAEPSGFAPSRSMTVASLGTFVCRVGKPDKGELEKYLAAIRKAVFYAEGCLGNCMAGLDDLTEAEIAFYRLDVRTAECCALQALFKARKSGQYEVESTTLFLLLRTYLYQGRFEKLQTVLEQIERLTEVPEFINRQNHYEIELGWFYAMIGERNRIAPRFKSDIWAHERGLHIDDFAALVKCKYYALEKNYSTMSAFLRSRTEGFGISHFLFGRIVKELVNAICQYELRNKADAMQHLRVAYDLAKPNEILMPFIAMGNHARSLIGYALKIKDLGIPTAWLQMVRSKATTYAKRVASVRNRYLESCGDAPLVQLTTKELRLLDDLSRGLSRSELALAQDISINTVKAMLQIVYEKLGAESGIEAVRIAASKNLI